MQFFKSKRFRSRSLGAVVVLAMIALAPTAGAQQDQLVPRDITQADDVIVEGSVCASDNDECVDGESFTGLAGLAEFKLKDNFPSLFFDTASSDWEVGMLGTAGNDDMEFVVNAGAGNNTPFTIRDTAPDNLVVIDDDGLGIGTTDPDRPLRIEGDSSVGLVKAVNTNAIESLRTLFSLENNGPPGFRLIDNSPGGANWVFRGSNSGAFSISEATSGLVEFRVATGGNVTIGGSLTQSSSSDNKDNIAPINVADVLAGVNELDLATWSYLAAPGVTHIGPMAEDFYETFDLGHGPNGITTVDADGVALAAIQALSAENAELRADNADLVARLDDVVTRLEALEAN